jgi:hypothetical protein
MTCRITDSAQSVAQQPDAVGCELKVVSLIDSIIFVHIPTEQNAFTFGCGGQFEVFSVCPFGTISVYLEGGTEEVGGVGGGAVQGAQGKHLGNARKCILV